MTVTITLYTHERNVWSFYLYIEPHSTLLIQTFQCHAYSSRSHQQNREMQVQVEDVTITASAPMGPGTSYHLIHPRRVERGYGARLRSVTGVRNDIREWKNVLIADVIHHRWKRMCTFSRISRPFLARSRLLCFTRGCGWMDIKRCY